MARLYAVFRRSDLALAVASVVLFAMALVAGEGMKSFAFLGAGILLAVAQSVLGRQGARRPAAL